MVVGPKFSDHGISSDSSQTDLAYFWARDQGRLARAPVRFAFACVEVPVGSKKFENLFFIICAMKSVSWDHFCFNNFDFL